MRYLLPPTPPSFSHLRHRCRDSTSYSGAHAGPLKRILAKFRPHAFGSIARRSIWPQVRRTRPASRRMSSADIRMIKGRPCGRPHCQGVRKDGLRWPITPVGTDAGGPEAVPSSWGDHKVPYQRECLETRFVRACRRYSLLDARRASSGSRQAAAPEIERDAMQGIWLAQSKSPIRRLQGLLAANQLVPPSAPAM